MSKHVCMAALFGSALIACSPEPETADVDRSALATSEQAAVRDACELATEADIEALTGEPVEARPATGGVTFSKCEYWGTVNDVPYFGLTVYWSGGREQWAISAAGYESAADIFRATEGVELDSVVQPGPVPGLGEAAIYAELTPAFVLKDDVLLEMFVFYLPNSKQNFRPLAEKLLARL